ncbi:MAG: PQQ-like beta-propeller repeat protein [Bryobacterales bacterium]|nr:PQQ-like beta-propeller repeat protein [Bryobacterales bacterium]
MVGELVYSFVRREGREVVAAIDAKTGEELWQSGYAVPYMPSDPAAAHGAGPKATPAYSDGRLFTLGIVGTVTAFDVGAGKLLWQTERPDEPPYFGAASSPLAGEGIVVAHPGNYGPLTAFDVLTGRVVWTVGNAGFFASPILAEFADMSQVVTITTNSVIGVSFPEGELLWSYPWNGTTGGPTPVVHGDTVIVSGHNFGTTAFNVIRANGEWTTETAWQTAEVSMYTSTPVVLNGILFGLSHRSRGQYFAVNATTGRVLWLGPPRTAENTAVVKADELLFLLNDDAELVVAEFSGSQFDELRRYSVADTATWAQPAITGKRMFVKDVDSLALWTFD